MHRVTGIVFALAGLVCAAHASAAYTKVDDFQSYPSAQFLPTSPTTYWNVSSATIANEELPSTNQYLYNAENTRSNNDDPALTLPDGDVGTLFFRFIGAGSPNVVGWTASPHESYQNATAGINLFSTGIQPFGASFVSVTWPVFEWYNLWIVVDSSIGTMDVFIQGGLTGPFVNQTQIGDDLPIQPGAEGLNLRSFNVSHGGFFDDIYVDTSGDSHLINPTVPEPALLPLGTLAMLGFTARRRRSAK